jgi:adenylate cyclase
MSSMLGSVRLGSVVTVASLLTVLGTAALIHIPWYYTSQTNIQATVEALNRQIVNNISREVTSVLDSAADALHSLHTILFQRVVESTHPAKREFLFLAHLQSHPSISWISFGWPDGNFFGSHKVSDDYIQMVETLWDPERKTAKRRIDHYRVAAGDIWFERREFVDTNFFAPEQPWYRTALAGNKGTWTGIYALPVSGKTGISTAMKLSIFNEFVGVINVAVALERISLFLQTLRVAKTGTVFILNQEHELVASQNPLMMPKATREGEQPRLMSIADGDYPFLRVAWSALQAQGVSARDIDNPLQLTQVDAEQQQNYFVTFAPLGANGWVVCTVIPETDFLETVNRNTQRLLLAMVFFTVTIAALAIVLARATIVGPLAKITAQIRHIENFELRKTTRNRSRIREIDALSSAMVRTTHGLAAFQRYLPTALVRTLLAEGIESKPQSRVATILFTDIAGFTAIAERMAPEAVVSLLNEYFSAVTKPIERHGGTITQYQGDAILAVFNVPSDDPNHASHAVRAALEIQDILRGRVFSSGIHLSTRIGINTGRVVAGSVGSEDRVNYTVHGDDVNLAARLEGLNKKYGTSVLVSERTARLIGNEYHPQRVGEVSIRGKKTTVTVFKLA